MQALISVADSTSTPQQDLMSPLGHAGAARFPGPHETGPELRLVAHLGRDEPVSFGPPFPRWWCCYLPAFSHWEIPHNRVNSYCLECYD